MLCGMFWRKVEPARAFEDLTVIKLVDLIDVWLELNNATFNSKNMSHMACINFKRNKIGVAGVTRLMEQISDASVVSILIQCNLVAEDGKSNLQIIWAAVGKEVGDSGSLWGLYL